MSRDAENGSHVKVEVDYLRYYWLETYLFEDVRSRFQEEGALSAFDFFSIVIWKANRAKSKVAHRLLKRSRGQTPDLDAVVRELTTSLFEATSPRERLRIFMEDWEFRLPMASAVLTVLWPETFTVYDVRACDQLGRFHQVANWSRFDRVWPSYVQFRDAVHAAGPEGRSLRDTDRYLWGRSAARQLEADIAKCFVKSEESG